MKVLTDCFRGKRVAYSAFGQVRSLNGEYEEGMTIVATGTQNCSHFSEEASLESRGQFRIRGLQPYCSYDVRVNFKGVDQNKIERIAPSSIQLPVIIWTLHILVVFHIIVFLTECKRRCI